MGSKIYKYELYYKIFIICLSCQAFFGFIAEEILPFLLNVKSFVFFITDLGFILLGVTVLRNTKDIILLMLFFLILFVTTVINDSSLIIVLNGTREFVSLLFVLPIIRYFLEDVERRDFFVKKFDQFILVFLILQLPTSIFQYFKYGPCDNVGGTMGNYNSGVLSTLIYMLTFYLFQKKIDPKNIFKSSIAHSYYFLLFIPSLLNETRSSFVFLILFLLCLIPLDRKLLFRTLFIIPLLLILFPVMMNLYLNITGNNKEVFNIDFYLTEYLFDEDAVAYAQVLDDGSIDVPRFDKVVEGVDLLQEQSSLLFGKGIGLFKGGQILATTAFAKEYKWLLSGSVIFFFFILIQLGIVGCIWILLYFIVNSPIYISSSKSNMNLYLYSLIVFLFICFYNDSFRLHYFTPFYLFILLQSAHPLKDT